MLHVRLLGQFDIRADGKPVTIPSRAGQSLFAYLILNAGTAYRREKLAGLLWPDTSDENARRNLRQELWRIRKALANVQPANIEYILAQEISLSFNANADYWMDVAQLEKPSNADDSSSELTSRLTLYRGELLPGFYDDWAVLERERLHGVFEHQMQNLMERLMREQRWMPILEWCERWIALGQSPEPAYRALMIAFAALGDKAKVTATFERCRVALDKELSVEPTEETRALFDQIMRGESVAGVNLTSTQVASAHPRVFDELPAPGEPPFKGLQYFDEGDADWFFGREPLTAKLVGRLRQHHFLAVIVGASGSGKSSIVRAGLIPALKKGEPLGDGILPHAGHGWQIHLLTPTEHPLEALALSFTRASESITATATLMDDLARDPRALRLYVNKLALNKHRRVLLVIDQFEELFTLCRDEFERQAFIDNLLAALPSGDVTLVIALRADFYAHLAQYEELRDAVAAQQEYIGPMTTDELRRAIEEPARRGHWEFQPGLVDLILRDVGNEPGALPLLSHALLETWNRRRGRTLTLKGYAESGGVRGAIAHTAETVFAQLTTEQQAIARNIFLRLTELGEGTEDTRRRASFTELIPRAENTETVRAVLNRLAEARLLTLNENTAEVAHEALIREWTTLREWLTQDRESLRLHRHLTQAAHEWELLEHDSGTLYRGARLAQADEWAQANGNALNDLERTFLDASLNQAQREAEEREAQRQRELQTAQILAEEQRHLAEEQKRRAEEQSFATKQLRQRARFLTGAFVLLLVMTVIALFLGDQARTSAATAQASRRAAEQERRTTFSRELAAGAINNLDVDPERSVLLALQAIQATYKADHTVTKEAEEALHRSVQAARAPLTLSGHTDVVNHAVFSPDGTRIATVSQDGRFKLWDAFTGKELLSGPTLVGNLFVAKTFFNQNGTRLINVNRGTGDTVVVETWDISSGRQLEAINLALPAKAITMNATSPDGTRMAFGSVNGSMDNNATVWDLTTGKLLLTLRGHTNDVLDVEFSPDGKRIATTSQDRTAKLWDAQTGDLLFTLSGHGLGIWKLAYSPDGTRVATASEDGTAKVWDATTGREIFTFSAHTNFVTAVAFSPDGKQVASTGFDRKTFVWDAKNGKVLFTFIGHGDLIADVDFSPDGKRLATASFDHTAKVWDLSPTREFPTLDTGIPLWGFSVTRDGKQIATAHPGGAVDLWDAATGERLITLPGKGFKPGGLGASDIAFSPDGSRLVRANDDLTAQVLDVATGTPLLDLIGHRAALIRVAYSPNGKQIATTSFDRSAKIWDAATGKEIFSLADHNADVEGVAFSPDGNLIATGSFKTVYMWDAHTGKLNYVLNAHTNVVFAIAFSPDSKRLVTGSRDGVAKVWDLATREELFQLSGHTSSVFAATYSHAGTRIATASYDATAKIWDAATGKELLTLSGHTNGEDGVAFSFDDARLITSSEDGTVRFYPLRIDDLVALAKARVTRTLTTDECQDFLHMDECALQP